MMQYKKCITLATMAFIFLSVTFTTYAGDDLRGLVTGKVIDANTKQPIPSVNVIIVGTTLGTITDIYGNYTIKGVEENVYNLKYSSLGYISHIENDIRVIRTKTTKVKDIELKETYVTGDSVIVTAGYFSKDNVTPTTNYTYSREEIRRSPGAAGDIFRAIETLPGVSSGGGEFSAFAVRGGSPRDNIVLVDNIPFDKVSHFDGGTEEQEAQGGRFSIFAPGLIDEANFQAGGFAAKYGGKNASFIDLKIKEGNKESFTANGTYDLLGWEINYDGPSYALGTTSLLFSARHQNFKKVLELTDKKYMGVPSFSDVILKTTTELSPQHKLSILGVYAPEDFERTLEHVFEAKNANYEPFVSRGNETKYLVGVNWRYLTSSASFWENTLYYKRTDVNNKRGKVYLDPVNGVMPTAATAATRNNYFVIDNSDYQYGWKSQFTFSPLSNSTIQTGTEIYRVNVDYNRTQNGFDTTFVFDNNDYRPNPTAYYIVVDPQNVNSSFVQNKLNANAFIDYKYDLTDRITIMPGLRYEYSGFNKNNYWSPRFSASYQLSDWTKLIAATGVYYQAPELRLFALDKQNEKLESEKAIHYILGVSTYLSDDIKFTAEAYYKDFTDLIVFPDRSTSLRNNAGSGYASGIDIGFVKRLSDQWYGQVNYSYSVSKRNDNNGNGEYDADFSQPNLFNILVGYELNKEWSFSAKWKYATGRPKDSYIVHENIFNNRNLMRYSKEITGNNNERLNDLHSLNVRVDYRYQFGNLAVVAFLDILNLYNRLNVSEEQFNEITGQSKGNGFQMIPTFGVKLEY
ncbi:MAG: TonB-dependent receptor [Ignavibacteriales bacterium]|nr:TonB-dependent receptor [Ignavibacteriales bacterium]